MNAIDSYVRDRLYKWLLKQGVFNVPKERIERKRQELYKSFLHQ